MLEMAFGVTGNGAADATGAEQENGLVEQSGADIGDGKRSAGVLEERQHAERGTSNLMGC